MMSELLKWNEHNKGEYSFAMGQFGSKGGLRRIVPIKKDEKAPQVNPSAAIPLSKDEPQKVSTVTPA